MSALLWVMRASRNPSPDGTLMDTCMSYMTARPVLNFLFQPHPSRLSDTENSNLVTSPQTAMHACQFCSSLLGAAG